MSWPQVIGTLLLICCAVFFAFYVTFLYLRRLTSGDRGLKSFGVWMRDLYDVRILGLG